MNPLPLASMLPLKGVFLIAACHVRLRIIGKGNQTGLKINILALQPSDFDKTRFSFDNHVFPHNLAYLTFRHFFLPPLPLFQRTPP
jgi:hypothetical protein